MRLSCVTITGFDDNTDPYDMIEISQKYPFVEFGILLHQNNPRPRYPSPEWLEELFISGAAEDCHCSAHLCGEDAFRARTQSLLLPDVVRHYFRRIQINAKAKDLWQVSLPYLRGWADAIDHEFSFIFQWRDDNYTKEFIKRLEDDSAGNYFDLLYDCSGGRGVLPEHWPNPIDNIRCGYAGGLNPYNLRSVLEQLDDMTDRTDLWIDVETGVRDEHNELDRKLVEEFLEVASEYVV